MRYQKNKMLTPEVEANLAELRSGASRVETLPATTAHLLYEFQSRQLGADEIGGVKLLRNKYKESIAQIAREIVTTQYKVRRALKS